MARTRKQQLPVKTFAKGLITEVSPLSFPVDASISEKNMDLLPDGTRRRRRGLRTSSTATPAAAQAVWRPSAAVNYVEKDAVYSTFLWKAAANSGDSDILVLQIESRLVFLKNNYEDPLTDEWEDAYITHVDIPSAEPCQFAVVNGHLVATVNQDYVTVFSYDPDTNTISSTDKRLSVRDLWGIDSGFAADFRPTIPPAASGGLYDAYLYNMFNNGWPSYAYWKGYTGGGSWITRPKEDIWNLLYGSGSAWPNALRLWPAESDVYGDYTVETEQKIAYSPSYLNSTTATTDEPLRGKAILDLFNRGTSRLSFFEDVRGSTTLAIPQDRSTGSITSVASFAGRVWYSVTVDSEVDTDDRSPNIGNMLFYSKTASNINDIGKCYATSDPTAVDAPSDPLDSDGGFITINDIGEVLRMEAISNSLLIFATNGIWEISGGDTGFTATNQTVSEVASISGLYPNSLVQAGSTIMIWSTEGILAISKGSADGRVSVANITEGTIQTRYNEISSWAKDAVKGIFIPKLKQIRWLYSDLDSSIADAQRFAHNYNKEIVYHFKHNAFTVNEFTYFPYTMPTAYRPLSTITVQTSDYNVVDNSGNQVVTYNYLANEVTGTETFTGGFGSYTVSDPYSELSVGTLDGDCVHIDTVGVATNNSYIRRNLTGLVDGKATYLQARIKVINYNGSIESVRVDLANGTYGSSSFGIAIYGNGALTGLYGGDPSSVVRTVGSDPGYGNDAIEALVAGDTYLVTIWLDPADDRVYFNVDNETTGGVHAAGYWPAEASPISVQNFEIEWNTQSSASNFEVQIDTVTWEIAEILSSPIVNNVVSSATAAVDITPEPLQYIVPNMLETMFDDMSTGWVDSPMPCYPKLAELTDDSFREYGIFPIEAYLETGYATGDDSTKPLRSPYVFVQSARTETGFTDAQAMVLRSDMMQGAQTPGLGSDRYEWVDLGGGALDLVKPSSVRLQGWWGWTQALPSGYIASTPTVNTYSSEQEAYRLPRFLGFQSAGNYYFPYEVVTTKNKVRGSGKALSLRLDASTTEPTQAQLETYVGTDGASLATIINSVYGFDNDIGYGPSIDTNEYTSTQLLYWALYALDDDAAAGVTFSDSYGGPSPYERKIAPGKDSHLYGWTIEIVAEER